MLKCAMAIAFGVCVAQGITQGAAAQSWGGTPSTPAIPPSLLAPSDKPATTDPLAPAPALANETGDTHRDADTSRYDRPEPVGTVQQAPGSDAVDAPHIPEAPR